LNCLFLSNGSRKWLIIGYTTINMLSNIHCFYEIIQEIIHDVIYRKHFDYLDVTWSILYKTKFVFSMDCWTAVIKYFNCSSPLRSKKNCSSPLCSKKRYLLWLLTLSNSRCVFILKVTAWHVNFCTTFQFKACNIIRIM
jgi:hypothetical protein